MKIIRLISPIILTSICNGKKAIISEIEPQTLIIIILPLQKFYRVIDNENVCKQQ